MSTISNTTVISNFAAIGQMSLLHQVHQQIHISMQVYEEISTGLEEGYMFYSDIKQFVYPFAKTGWIKMATMADDNEFDLFERLPSKLGKGEASCLSIAANRDWLFLTDDLSARKQAALMKIRFSGSLGCLMMAIEKNKCSFEKANQLLFQMIESGYHSPVYDLKELI